MRKSTMSREWDESDGDQVRVLLECAPEHSPEIIATLIRRHGYAVRTCTGPGDRPCSLLEHGACRLVDGADVVVNMLGAHQDDGAALQGVAALRRPPAIVAELPHGAVAPTTRSGAPVTVVPAPMTRRSLLDAIVESLGQEAGRPTPPSVPAPS